MSIVDLDSCVQEEGESITHWMRRVSTILHSSDGISAGSAVLMLEKNCRFLPLKRKLGRLKRHCKDMGELMAALVKYADSDTTKDPEFEVEQPGKVKKSGSIKGQQYSPASQGGNGKRKADGHLDFVANANAQKSNQYRKGKPPPRSGGPSFNLDQLMNQPCPKHSKQDRPAAHLWKDCFLMKEYAKANSFQNNHGPGRGLAPALMARTMVAAAQIPVFKLIKVVIINSQVRGLRSSSSLVTRVNQSS